MKQVRFAAFLSSIVLWSTFSSLAQTSQPSKSEPASPPAQAAPQNVSPQATTPLETQKAADPSGAEGQRIKIKIVPRRNKTSNPWQLPDMQLEPEISVPIAGQVAIPGQSPGGSIDRGIYLRRMAGTGMCGSIVSYNFSQGENPILESVTKCTPAGVTAVRRARGRDEKPAVPQFREIQDTQP